MTKKSSNSRSLASHYGQIGAHIMHSRHCGREVTKAARDEFLSSFERQVDPDGVLNPEERARRAAHARSAHFARLALLSAQKRAARRKGGDR